MAFGKSFRAVTVTEPMVTKITDRAVTLHSQIQIWYKVGMFKADPFERIFGASEAAIDERGRISDAFMAEIRTNIKHGGTNQVFVSTGYGSVKSDPGLRCFTFYVDAVCEPSLPFARAA